MLVFCTTIIVYLENLNFFIKAICKLLPEYKAVKSSCLFSGHLRPLLGNPLELLRADSGFTGTKSFDFVRS
jgi:hypothetical protein